MTIQRKLEDSYKITEIDRGGNHIAVSITVNDDGSFHILDHSYGLLADAMYGDGRDVEHWLDIGADAVRKFSTEMTGAATPDAANDLAKLLAKTYQGENLALKSIKDLCDKKNIDFKEEFWPW